MQLSLNRQLQHLNEGLRTGGLASWLGSQEQVSVGAADGEPGAGVGRTRLMETPRHWEAKSLRCWADWPTQDQELAGAQPALGLELTGN